MTTLECENASVLLETDAPTNGTTRDATTMVVIKNSSGAIIFNMIITSRGQTIINVNVDSWDRRSDLE